MNADSCALILAVGLADSTAEGGEKRHAFFGDVGLTLDARLVVFCLTWATALKLNRHEVLRSLSLAFGYLESEEEQATGSYLLTRLCRESLCTFLSELIDDDENWTGFTLPGESP